MKNLEQLKNNLISNPLKNESSIKSCEITKVIRDRPFNLKGGGGYGFLFRELEYFFLSRKARNFFPEFNIRLYYKNSESDFFFLHQNQNILFINIGNQNIFLEKKTITPLFKLNVRSLIYRLHTKNFSGRNSN